MESYWVQCGFHLSSLQPIIILTEPSWYTSSLLSPHKVHLRVGELLNAVETRIQTHSIHVYRHITYIYRLNIKVALVVHSCFVQGRSQVQISTRRPGILMRFSVVFLSPSRKIPEKKGASQGWVGTLPSTSFPIHYY
jgi:hypothetical protein